MVSLPTSSPAMDPSPDFTQWLVQMAMVSERRLSREVKLDSVDRYPVSQQYLKGELTSVNIELFLQRQVQKCQRISADRLTNEDISMRTFTKQNTELLVLSLT